MLALLLFLLLVFVLFGSGFALHALWWVAVIAAIVWIVGFFTGPRPPTGGRWYRW